MVFVEDRSMENNNLYQAPSSNIQSFGSQRPKLKDLLFSFEGRIRRTDWWLAVLVSFGIVIVASIIAGVLANVMGEAVIVILVLAYIPLIWIGIATAAKRMHDHGKSGWFQLIGLIPFVGIYIFILCGCMRGNVGANAYGEDPF